MKTCIYFMDEDCDSADNLNELSNNNLDSFDACATVTFAHEVEIKLLPSAFYLKNEISDGNI